MAYNTASDSPIDVSTILDDDEGNRVSPFNNNTTEDSGVSAANQVKRTAGEALKIRGA